MIPLTTLYNEYIDWPKLSEQKKVEYIVHPPSRGVGSTENHIGIFDALTIVVKDIRKITSGQIILQIVLS